MSANETLEHAEHIAHAGHAPHGKPDSFGVYVGITIAILGVLLAFASSLVGDERTALLQKIMEEGRANTRYQAEEVKHRVSFLALTQAHATAFATSPPMANRVDMLAMAQNVNRYLAELSLAQDYRDSFGPLIDIHRKAQDAYDRGLLLAEIGVVVASIALLMRRKEPWFVAIALGVGCMYMVSATAMNAGDKMKMAEHSIDDARMKYEQSRNDDKTTAEEKRLVTSIIGWADAAER